MKNATFAAMIAWAAITAGPAAVSAAAGPDPARAQAGVLPVSSRPLGLTYGQWSAKWWQWGLSHPVEGHPFVDSPQFDVSSGQSGPVWFLAAPLETVVRSGTIPAGKSLFVAVINSAWSDLEGYATEPEQRELAAWFADHMSGIFCTINGVPVADIDSYRVASPQFSFNAPSPWIFGPTGGLGTAVAEGTYVFIPPLPLGTHTLHFGGEVHFSIALGDPFDLDAYIDMTYHLTVVP